MITDPLANLVAAGRARRGTAAPAPVEGEVLDALAGLSRPHRAILAAAGEVLGLLTASADRMPIHLRVMVSSLRGLEPMVHNAVAGMPEEDVRRLLEQLRARVDDALTDA